MRTRLNYYTHARNFYLCLDHYYNCPSFLQAVVLFMPTKSPSVPPHFSLTPQPSLCLVLPVEDHPQLTLGEEMIKSSLTVPHTTSPYKWNVQFAGFQNSRYRSTLTVTGRLPGVYQYSVTNRATYSMVTGTFTIEGNWRSERSE